MLLVRSATRTGHSRSVLTGAVVVAVSLLAGADVQAGFAYAVTWFLLLAGVRPVGSCGGSGGGRGQGPTDADQLARLTRVPGGVWVGFFGLGTLAALSAGGWVPAHLSTER